MGTPAFEIPLSNEELIELGKLVVNCGSAEFLLNIHLGKMLNLDGSSNRDLVAPLATKRKIEIMKSRLKDITNLKTRTLVQEGCDIFGAQIGVRNMLLHGIWGFESDRDDAKVVVVSPKDSKGHRTSRDILRCAEQLAIAAKKLSEALIVDAGQEPNMHPERLIIELAK